MVSKPHLECIQKICETFTDYKDKILFRFTIGSADSQVLKFWEPNASSFEERLECLALAYRMGYQTSASAEPLLDKNVDDLISKLSPYITDTIWIGKPNMLLSGTRMNGHDDLLPSEIQLLDVNESKFVMDICIPDLSSNDSMEHCIIRIFRNFND